MSGSEQTSWFGFAKAIFDMLQQRGFKVPELNAIPSSDYPTPARRPSYSCLDNQKLLNHFGLQLPAWSDTLKMVMEDKIFINESEGYF